MGRRQGWIEADRLPQRWRHGHDHHLCLQWVEPFRPHRGCSAALLDRLHRCTQLHTAGAAGFQFAGQVLGHLACTAAH